MAAENKRSLTTLLVILIGAVLVGVAVLVINIFFERYDETVNDGWSMEAWQNPNLAAVRFLERLGIDVNTELHLSDLMATGQTPAAPVFPDHADTLIMNYTYVFESPALYQPLIDWIRGGGHLILDMSNYSDDEEIERDTSFVDFLQVRTIPSDFFEGEDTLTEAQVWEDSEVLNIAFLPFYYLETEREEEVLLDFWDDYGSHLMEFTEGKGQVTVLSDTEIWDNSYINDHDHATLLAHLLAGRSGQVFFILKTDMPSLWRYIWSRIPELATALLVLALLLIWRLYNRFGPIITTTEQIRRSLQEHLLATGRFFWQYRLGDVQLDQVRAELVNYLENRHPQWCGREQDEQTLWLAERAGLETQSIHQALHGTPRKVIEFTNAIRTLQTLRNRL